MKNTYGRVERLRTPDGNLSDIIEKFGANNRHLANKSAKESQKVRGSVTIFEDIFSRLAELR